MRLIPIALVLCCASAAAQQFQDRQQPKIAPGLLTVYSEYDLNGDGSVATQEFITLLPPELQPAGRTCDADGNGDFSQSEYDACTAGTPTDTAPQPR